MTKARDLANSAAAFAAVSATELAFVDGVTSAIQTQMDAKAPSSTAVTLTGTQTLTNKTLTSPVIASVINNTLTSTTGDIIYASGANTPARLGIGSSGQVLNVSGGVPAWATPSGGTPFTTDIVVNSATVGRGAGNLSSNTVFGNGAFAANTTGIENTAIGTNALKTSAANTDSTAVGWGSLELAANADKNTGVGYNSLYNVTSGARNTGMGSRTGISLTTGSTNTILGEAAGQTLATGGNNTLIGCGSATAASNSNNTVTLGDNSIGTLRCQVTSITALSDARDKKNVEPLQVGLDFVNDLKPVKFDWNMRSTTDIDGNEVRGKVDVPDVGFIAQDLVAQEDASGLADYLQLTYRDNPEKLEATQGRLIPILVKAIQELSAKVAALEANV